MGHFFLNMFFVNLLYYDWSFLMPLAALAPCIRIKYIVYILPGLIAAIRPKVIFYIVGMAMSSVKVPIGWIKIGLAPILFLPYFYLIVCRRFTDNPDNLWRD